MKQTNRWFYALIGVIVLLFDGMVYAWSVLSMPIAQEYPDWTKAQLSLTFTIVMILFCIGCMAGGMLAPKTSCGSRRRCFWAALSSRRICTRWPCFIWASA